MTNSAVLHADFHMHTHYSKDSDTRPDLLVKRALQVGLSCIAVTDHNTIKGALEVKQMAPPELKVIIAEEIKTPFGEITGFFLKEGIPRGLSPVETCERIKAQGGLVSIPHPFDRVRRSVLKMEMLESILDYIDIVEVFNSRTTLLEDSEKARSFAQKHGFLAGAGSDSHTAWELGHLRIEMPNFGDAASFKDALKAADINGRRTTPLIHILTTMTKWRKKYIYAPADRKN
jgi:predicted metal-dependent phosphoesterase TrpH